MRSILFAVSLALTSAGGAWAQPDEEDHAAHHPNAQASQPAQSEDVAAAPRAGGMPFKAIEALMARIQQTDDASQRADLLRQHAFALREQVRAMRAASGKRMAMMGGQGKPASAADDPHAAHKAGAADERSAAGDAGAGGDDPHAAHKADASSAPSEGKAGKQGMMGGGMMKMHEGIERRLDAIERVLEQLIEREVVEGSAR